LSDLTCSIIFSNFIPNRHHGISLTSGTAVFVKQWQSVAPSSTTSIRQSYKILIVITKNLLGFPHSLCFLLQITGQQEQQRSTSKGHHIRRIWEGNYGMVHELKES
ncbi:hypothetical protein, partial [Vibrio aestuarianus]|uniref:hypothetical protein n=1 Tax=Vibrio aestuarianus TaxID=28171 RepID=UPI00237C6690